MDNKIVFIQTCIVGEIHTDFLRCCQVKCGDAEGIRGAIEKDTTHLDMWERFCNKLVALGSDGASVMTGNKHGVIALLQKKKSSIIGIQCCGHRLELTYQDAICKNPLAEKIATLLSGLYYFYKQSALNRTNLKHAYKAIGMKVLLPTHANGTR